MRLCLKCCLTLSINNNENATQQTDINSFPCKDREGESRVQDARIIGIFRLVLLIDLTTSNVQNLQNQTIRIGEPMEKRTFFNYRSRNSI
jgi:hypothetical protein